MYSPSEYAAVKLTDGHLVEQIKNTNQKDWVKVCQKLGLFVPEDGGHGSHRAVYKSNTCPPEDSSCCVIVLPCKIYPNFQRDLVKKLVYHGKISGKYTEDDLWEALGVKKH